ncbi:sulfite exporter TauE/SafE family protein [Azohydromonas aeria]|uniref:sulfite exporter TauE/SafE family protein n=1 Tax=Azohydromonas aeria TaxID=2590212 RepID=UPI0012F7C50E|nr:sulfite exporter TauE/SafE family protein [Azohydromonas aeria]
MTTREGADDADKPPCGTSAAAVQAEITVGVHRDFTTPGHRPARSRRSRPRVHPWLGHALGLVAAGLLLLAVQRTAASASDWHPALRWGAVAAALFVTAAMASTTGFAFGAIAAVLAGPFFSDAATMVAIGCVCNITIQAYAVARLRRDVRLPALAPMLVAGLVGTPLGVWLLLHANTAQLSDLLGLLLVGWGLQGLWRQPRWQVRDHRPGTAVAGLLGGLMSGFSGAPSLAPVVWLQLRGVPKLEARAQYQPFILAMQLCTLACLAAFGGGPRTPPADVLLLPALACAAAAMAGAQVGMRVFARMSDARFTRWVALLLALSGASLVLKAL